MSSVSVVCYLFDVSCQTDCGLWRDWVKEGRVEGEGWGCFPLYVHLRLAGCQTYITEGIVSKVSLTSNLKKKLILAPSASFLRWLQSPLPPLVSTQLSTGWFVISNAVTWQEFICLELPHIAIYSCSHPFFVYFLLLFLLFCCLFVFFVR